MAFQPQGFSGVVAEVESNTRALRGVLRPTDFGALGVYSVGAATGTIGAGAGANSEIFQFRWTDATRLAVIKFVAVSAGNTATAFAAGVTNFDVIAARSFTGAGTGGTTLTLTTNNAKLRTNMGTTLVGEIRVATTAALGAGTKTLDAQGFGNGASSVPATAGSVVIPYTQLYNPQSESEYPIVLAQNEGIVIRATVPGTGTWTAGIQVKWAEYTAY
jgi:hypothetical protein